MRSNYLEQRPSAPLIPASVYFTIILTMVGLASATVYIGARDKPRQTRVYLAQDFANLQPKISGRKVASGSLSVSPAATLKIEKAVSGGGAQGVIVVDRSSAVTLSDVASR